MRDDGALSLLCERSGRWGELLVWSGNGKDRLPLSLSFVCFPFFLSVEAVEVLRFSGYIAGQPTSVFAFFSPSLSFSVISRRGPCLVFGDLCRAFSRDDVSRREDGK